MRPEHTVLKSSFSGCRFGGFLERKTNSSQIHHLQNTALQRFFLGLCAPKLIYLTWQHWTVPLAVLWNSRDDRPKACSVPSTSMGSVPNRLPLKQLLKAISSEPQMCLYSPISISCGEATCTVENVMICRESMSLLLKKNPSQFSWNTKGRGSAAGGQSKFLRYLKYSSLPATTELWVMQFSALPISHTNKLGRMYLVKTAELD